MSHVPAVLIVDDTAENRRMYAAMLADTGVEVLVADSAAAALEACAGREFAMILLDVNMPEVDGFEAARRLRALPLAAHVPIVFVSAVFTRDIDTHAGYSEGAVDYLTTPVVPYILRCKVAAFADMYRHKFSAREQAAALDAAHRELQAAYAELETFSYCAAHDLRSPISQIAAFARFLKADAGELLDADCQEHLARIAGAAVRANELIDDLLKLAQLAHTVAEHDPVDLSALAAEIAAGLDASERQRRVDWRIMPGLTVRGDYTMLHTLLQNLLGNAWKYSGKTAQACIEFGASEINGRQVFFVRDNGAGFDMAHAAKLFQPFQRLHGQGEFPGTGVGLAIVQRIVAKHEGEICAEAERGKGAAFHFTLAAAATEGEPA